MNQSYLINTSYRDNTSFPNAVGLNREPRLVDYCDAKEQSQHYTLRHFIFRKLSTIPLLFETLVNTIMKFKRTCTENPKVQDDWERDEDGIETLVNCNNEKKEVKRY